MTAQKIIDEIRRLFADTSVSQAATINDLENIIDECDTLLNTLEDSDDTK